MFKTVVFLTLALFAGCASTSSAPPQHEHTFAFLRVGPKRGEFTGAPLQELMRGHMANIGVLAEEGKLCVAGPMGQNNPEPELRGIFIFTTSDVREAQALCEGDPSIEAGVLAAEVVPFRTDRDLVDVLRRGMEFEERRKADPSISMMEGMSTYALLVAEDGARAAKALDPVRAAGQIALEGTFGGARAGQALFLLDVRDLAAAETLLANVRGDLGTHKLLPWFGSAELRK
jgi:uncharacterized protein YciI